MSAATIITDETVAENAKSIPVELNPVAAEFSATEARNLAEEEVSEFRTLLEERYPLTSTQDGLAELVFNKAFFAADRSLQNAEWRYADFVEVANLSAGK